MAEPSTTPPTPTPTPTTSNPRRACFSFAAYVKNLISHLKSRGVPVLDGLTDREFSSIQSTFNFVFPPDLRSILSEGLPVGPGFPNWRSSSSQQLRILLDLPALSISKEISNNRFWCQSWGDKSDTNPEENLATAKLHLNKAPILVPVYGHCYIASTSPTSAGNPVFFVRGGDVRYVGAAAAVKAPVWAAKEARRVEVWTEMVERGRWEGDGTCEGKVRHVLGDCFDEMSWILRDGGGRTRERVMSRVRAMSLVMLRGGWSVDDVVYSLGIDERVVHREIETS
ncbi:hypothetical protein Syun_004441 [Stephania yunnanensis]|uniref:Uncharacterized protein n=1 Tax=Stephania yunnanensis TaxID=152371 RepID=A0AAP0Q2J2_9MAGN